MKQSPGQHRLFQAKLLDNQRGRKNEFTCKHEIALTGCGEEIEVGFQVEAGSVFEKESPVRVSDLRTDVSAWSPWGPNSVGDCESLCPVPELAIGTLL